MKSAWRALFDEITNLDAEMRELAVSPRVEAETIRSYLQTHYDFAQPVPLNTLLTDVERMMREWNVQVTHPCYYGLFNPSAIPASVVADALVALYNPQLAAWSHAPAANEIERFTLKFFLRKLRFDDATSFGCFTTGGAESNLSAVVAALVDRFPSFAEQGIATLGAQPRMYISEEGHHSFDKAAIVTGIGRKGIRTVAVDSALRVNVEDLAQKLAQDLAAGHRPFMVVGTAGTTGAGAVDDLPKLAELCRTYKLWFHVDAAWGGLALLSPRLRACVEGIEEADSVTWDAHKGLSVPMGAGMFFCRHKEVIFQAFGIRTPYMPSAHGEGGLDPYATTLQWTRRFIGLKVFMALAALGESGYRNLIEQEIRMGDLLRKKLAEAGWILKNETPLPLVCFTHAKIMRGEFTTSDVLKRVYARQKVWISEVRLGGKESVLRACVTSYKTRPEDLNILIEELSRAIGS